MHKTEDLDRHPFVTQLVFAFQAVGERYQQETEVR